MKVSLNFLNQIVKSSIMCGYEKEGFIKIPQLVVVETIFDTTEKLSRCVLRI